MSKERKDIEEALVKSPIPGNQEGSFAHPPSVMEWLEENRKVVEAWVLAKYGIRTLGEHLT